MVYVVFFAASGVIMLVAAYLNDLKSAQMMELGQTRMFNDSCTFSYTTPWYEGVWFECRFPLAVGNTTCDFVRPKFFYIGRGFENKRPDPSSFVCFNLASNLQRPTPNLVLYILGAIFCAPMSVLLLLTCTLIVPTFLHMVNKHHANYCV